MPQTALTSVVCCSSLSTVQHHWHQPCPRQDHLHLGGSESWAGNASWEKGEGKLVNINVAWTWQQYFNFERLMNFKQNARLSAEFHWAEYLPLLEIVYVRIAPCLKILKFTMQGQLWQQLTKRVIVKYVKFLQLHFTNTCQIIGLLTKKVEETLFSQIKMVSELVPTAVILQSGRQVCDLDAAAAAAGMILGQS